MSAFARRLAERDWRVELQPLVDDGALDMVPHTGWLTSPETFRASQGDGSPYRMDAFYRAVRREHDVLMDDGEPAGGRFSFDAENRKAWKGEPPAPEPPRFPLDPIKEEVVELIERCFGDHPERLTPDTVAEGTSSR